MLTDGIVRLREWDPTDAEWYGLRKGEPTLLRSRVLYANDEPTQIADSYLHPRVTDLIFYPPPELVNASPETIVDVALSYRPIAL